MTRYELLERIGAGRMAEIFRGKAVVAGGFEQPVAIKRILPQLASDQRFVELLIAEAKILSALRHRNIVQIVDVGVGEDAAYFLVMEYVDGIDLGALQRGLERRRARLALDLVLHLGAELCDALDYAQHTPMPDGRPMNLVHRDVTPSNVLVSRSGEVKLTDFGLARRPDDKRTGSKPRGRSGYVSPEQVTGLPVDGRADVFSVGVMMWELAVGRRLFSGMADSDALRAVVEAVIPAPSSLDRALPAELDAILASALARDIDLRLPSAGELGGRLRGLRYSLESSSGDPAATLARTVAGMEREPSSPATLAAAERSGPFDGSQRSVVKIETAAVFAQRDPDGTGLLAARRLLDAFDDAEPRMSLLPGAFDEISTGGLALRAGDDPTEAEGAPMQLGGETGDVLPLSLDTAQVRVATDLPRDTAETPAVEASTVPAAGASGGASETAAGSPAAAPPGGAPIDTLRGGQVAPVVAPPRVVRAPALAPPPEPVAVSERAVVGSLQAPSSARERDGSPPPSAAPVVADPRRPPRLSPLMDWDQGIDDWTEKTPPPEADPSSSWSPLPAFGPPAALSPARLAPLVSDPRLAGGLVSDTRLAGGGEAATAAPEPRSADPAPSYPPAGSGPGGWTPDLAPGGGGLARVRRWWPVAVGAIAIAILSFVITRALITPKLGEVPSSAPLDGDELSAVDAAAAAPVDGAAPSTPGAVGAVDAGASGDVTGAFEGAAGPVTDGGPADDAGPFDAAGLDDAPATGQSDRDAGSPSGDATAAPAERAVPATSPVRPPRPSRSRSRPRPHHQHLDL